MKEIVTENTKTPKKDNTTEALPAGAGEGTPFDFQTVESIGIAMIKKIGKFYLSPENQAALQKISDNNYGACLNFLSGLDYKENKPFLNVVHRCSFACANGGAAVLVSCGASVPHDNNRDVVYEAFTKSPEQFNKVVDDLVSKQPFPQKAFRVIQKKKNLPVVTTFTDAKISELENALGKLFLEKGCTEYAKVRIQHTNHMVGLMIEHANPQTHFSTVDTTHKPSADYQNLRLRTSDFVWVDKYSAMLWIKSGLINKRYKEKFLTALGVFFCDDPAAFTHEHSPNLAVFNTPAFASALQGFNIPAIKRVELRELYYRKAGVSRGNLIQLSGPENKGCVTELPDWKQDLPPQWQTRDVHLVFETVAGDRESIVISSLSIKVEHSPNLPLSIALLKYFKVIPNNDN